MLVVWTALSAALLLVTVGTAVVSRRPSWRRSRVEAVALRAALPADPDLVPAPLLARVGARIARRTLAERTGALVGAALVLALLLAGSDADRSGVVVVVQTGPDGAFGVVLSSLTLVAPLVLVAGRVLPVLLVAGRDALAPPASSGPRLARTCPPRREDYVPRIETVVVRALVLAPVGVLVVAVVVRMVSGRSLADLVPPAALVAVSVLVWTGVEGLCRRLLAQPRPAACPLELAWDDVLRAPLLREMAQLPLLLAAAAVVVVVLQLLTPAGGADAGAAVLALAVVVAVVVAGLLGLVVSLVTRSPERYVRARLWPLPADPEGADPALAPVGLR